MAELLDVALGLGKLAIFEKFLNLATERSKKGNFETLIGLATFSG
jgi:hypothetical protein